MHWLYTIAMASITFPLGVLMRLIPVPDKPSDFADFYQQKFNAKMTAKLADTEGGHPAFAEPSTSDGPTSPGWKNWKRSQPRTEIAVAGIPVRTRQASLMNAFGASASRSTRRVSVDHVPVPHVQGYIAPNPLLPVDAK